MFEFFEGLIEKLGVRLVSDFTEKLIDFIRDVKQNSNNENNRIDNLEWCTASYNILHSYKIGLRRKR